MSIEHIRLKDNLIQELQDLPQLILQRQTELLTKKYNLQAVRELMRETETQHLSDVAADPVYSNDSKRKIELKRRLDENPAYVAYIADEEKMSHELDQLTTNLEFMQNKFSAARALARLMGGQD